MIDATIAQLDSLFAADRARQRESLARLQSIVSALDGSSSLTVDEHAEGSVWQERRREVTAPAEPYVPLPRRKTPGGRFGPAVVAKLRSEALGR
jgi:hypothetical protein